MEPATCLCFRLGEGADCDSWSLERGRGRSYLVTTGFHIFQGTPGKREAGSRDGGNGWRNGKLGEGRSARDKC